MIPTHILTDLKSDERVAVLSRGGNIHFHIHPATATPADVRAFAEREGSEVLTTHMHNEDEIREFVAARERDTGGEG